MSNPTANFNWQMPTNTDLVSALPADFEVFGQAVDTAFVDLLGGTTGQVLSKTSGTNMDFTWVTPDVAGKLRQVVSATYSTSTSTTSTSFVDTGLSVSITPTSASSNVLVIVSQWFEKTTGNVGNAVNVTLFRGATELAPGGKGAYFYSDSNTRLRSAVPILFLDSPATTSATTYKTQFASNVSGQTATAQVDGYTSSIVLLEIGA
jgi:hypothetical protein